MTRNLRPIIALFGFATLAALLVRLVVIEDYRISSDSMYPTLIDGDLVFVSKSAFNLRFPFSTYELINFRQPRRGEVVAFTLPEHGLSTFVKRVIAVEADTVEIRKGVLYVNNVASEYEPLRPGEASVRQEKNPWGNYPVRFVDGKVRDYGPVDIPKNHFFALGDNREDSVDSRLWGPVPYSCLKGRVSLVWLSVSDKGIAGDRIGLWVQ